MNRRGIGVALIWCVAVMVTAAGADEGRVAQAPPAPERLAVEVFELVQKNCIECHGAAREAQLDLRTDAGLQKGGRSGRVVVPRDAAASLLYRAVTHDGDLRMPEEAPKLPDAAIRIIKLWIEAGASWATVPEANGGGH